MEYNTIQPVKLFVMNNKNISKLIDDSNKNIRDICTKIFGTNLSIVDKIKISDPPIWIFEDVECFDQNL